MNARRDVVRTSPAALGRPASPLSPATMGHRPFLSISLLVALALLVTLPHRAASLHRQHARSSTTAAAAAARQKVLYDAQDLRINQIFPAMKMVTETKDKLRELDKAIAGFTAVRKDLEGRATDIEERLERRSVPAANWAPINPASGL